MTDAEKLQYITGAVAVVISNMDRTPPSDLYMKSQAFDTALYTLRHLLRSVSLDDPTTEDE